MRIFNYLTLLVALLMMNIMYAELKTFGMPADTETEELPPEEKSTDETPGDETPSEETPSDETPSEDNEMPSASEDSEVNTDQPIKFKEEYVVSLNLGTAIPAGENLNTKFSSGSNLEANVSTPFNFSGINVIGHLGMLNLSASNSAYTNYSVTKLGIKLAKNVSFLNINLGTGLAMASGVAMEVPYDDYDMTTLYLSGDLSYALPLSGILSKPMNGQLADLNISIYAGGLMIFGAPAKAGTSNLVNMGLSISYPFLF